jgi:hypothetical protein
MKKGIDVLYGTKGGAVASRVAEVRALIIPTYTTTQKRALVVAEGTVVYDSTLNKLCVYTAEAGGSSTGWETITSTLE